MNKQKRFLMLTLVISILIGILYAGITAGYCFIWGYPSTGAIGIIWTLLMFLIGFAKVWLIYWIIGGIVRTPIFRLWWNKGQRR